MWFNSKKDIKIIYKISRHFLSKTLRYKDVLRSFAEYKRYLQELYKYSQMQDAEPIQIGDLNPILFERSNTSKFDAHYFYLNIWAAKRLMSTKPSIHVDIGSAINFVGFTTCFTKIIFIDIRPLLVELQDYQSLPGSLMALPFAERSINSISCLHVAEHIGLGRYGDPLDPAGTKKAINEMKRVVASGGNLFFALPVGKPRLCFNGHRVHSVSQILYYFDGLQLLEFSGVDDHGIYREHISLDIFDSARYACGFFWFTK
ncbi:MAG: DUF268 domain-containing protein [Caldilinea sp. CFX5]|nr:DUF268 domain-containing protein [Caldilinea sp. CFX5]